MSRFVHYYSASVSGLRSLLPMLAGLAAVWPDHTSIASSIPGMGACKSTFCKAERRGFTGQRRGCEWTAREIRTT